MNIVTFDMYQTLAITVCMLILGNYLKKHLHFLETYCIPASVIGGFIFAIIASLLFYFGVIEFSFDETLKTVCMVVFFTSVGFQANLKILRKGGISLLIFIICVTALIVCQNLISIILSNIMKVNALFGLCTGSIPMLGGHGTSGAFGKVLEELGLENATTFCTAAATFGLIAGSLMGGPLGKRLILKHNLQPKKETGNDAALLSNENSNHKSVAGYATAVYQICIAMGIGTIVSSLISKIGMTVPTYIGAMIVAAFMRNISEYSGKFTIKMDAIDDIGGICLSLFLGAAMITLKLWQLAALALPLIILLVAQVVLMFIFAYFIIFNVMGKDYDAAVLAAGTCGFGLGATPNAMANMQVLTEKYGPSVKAYILVPIAGSMFADFINSILITVFINMV